jgi:uncharacterized protein YndB with AHSA1/START domain
MEDLMTDDLTYTFTVAQSPAEAFAAINDVRAWWSGDIDGQTDVLGAEWSYRVPDIHYSAHRITELVPERSVAWLGTDGWLSFVEDKQEWTGTTIRFDLTPTVTGGTEVRFTHVGLEPQVECYGVCRVAWSEYILGSLKDLIGSGAGRPDSFGEGKLDEAKARAQQESGSAIA